MKKSIKTLKAERLALSQKMDDLWAEISQREDDRLRPILEKKYLNRYFRVKEGGWQLNEINQKVYWFIYFHVVEAKPDYEAQGWSFEKTANGEIRVKSQDSWPYDLLKDEISEAEFRTEYEHLIEALVDLKPLIGNPA